MRVLLFSSQHYDQESFTQAANGSALELHFQPARLTLDTAALASGYEAVCAFINDELDAPVLQRLAEGGTRLIALR
ncbi:MAG: 2-hydroxyacid dehydrogenase, partial [Pseudomonas putida]